MAKKTAKKKTTKKTVKKPVTKSPAKKSVPAKKSSAKKTTTKKPAAKKTAKKTSKKPAAKKSPTKKSTTKKPLTKTTTKNSTPKKTTEKPATKKTTAKSSPAKKTVAKKPAVKKKVVTKKTAAKKTPVKKTPVKKTPAKAPAAKPAAAGTKAAITDASKATGRKGITIVKPTKKTGSRSRAAPKKFVMPERPMLLGPGSKLAKKPLIPSGPTAPKVTSVLDAPKSRRKKSPLTKAKLDKYRALLIAKRAELLGDVVSMENEALRSDSGGAGSTSNHLAEQGSENYDQSLSLNLAAQDRRLIKDIDDALARVEDGSFGLCELTGHPIPEARLDELPWARYTIEAARELERRGTLG